MKKILFLVIFLITALSITATAGITPGNFTIEEIRQTTIGEYFMVAFLSVTITMYLFYLLDVHILIRLQADMERMQNQPEAEKEN